MAGSTVLHWMRARSSLTRYEPLLRRRPRAEVPEESGVRVEVSLVSFGGQDEFCIIGLVFGGPGRQPCQRPASLPFGHEGVRRRLAGGIQVPFFSFLPGFLMALYM